LKELKTDPIAVKKLKKLSSETIYTSPKEIDKALADPTTKEAHSVYSFGFDKSVYHPELNRLNTRFINQIKAKGYNMLMDPADSTFGMYDLPMVLLDSKNTVDITGRTVVTKESRKKLKTVLRDYEKINRGKTFMEGLGFGY